jgi:hypothetical protein
MTVRTRTRWRGAATRGAVCLLVIVAGTAVWFRAAYHFWPGTVPTVVHWCGRDYEAEGSAQSLAQITKAEAPRQLNSFGTYPPIAGLSRPLLAPAAPGAHPAQPGGACTTAVFLRTGPGQYQWYTLEGGP